MTTTTETETLKGFRYAELARGEALQSPDVCDCCERQGLKKTIKLIHPSGRIVWYGTGCASKALGVGIKVINAARQDAEKRERAAAFADMHARWKAEDELFERFLSERAADAPKSWDGKPNRFAQIEALGGWDATRAEFKVWCAAQ